MFPHPVDNPHWTIDGEVVEEIVEKFGFLDAAKPTYAGGYTEGEIAYKGFVLVNVDNDPALPREIRMCDGLITATENGPENSVKTNYYRDEYNIEALLAKMAVG